MPHLIYCHAIFMFFFNDNNVSIFSEPWNESYHDAPLFLFHVWIIYMYIFHLVKGQEHFDSRSKMAHMPLSQIGKE